MVIQGAINSMFGGFARTITVPNSRKTWKASGDVIEAKVLSVEQRQPFIQVNAKNASQEGFYSREAAAASRTNSDSRVDVPQYANTAAQFIGAGSVRISSPSNTKYGSSSLNFGNSNENMARTLGSRLASVA